MADGEMAEAAWRARFRQRVVYADECFGYTGAVLDAAEAVFLPPPIQEPAAAQQNPAAPAPPTAAAERGKIQSALVSLREATHYLDSAIANAQAARILALQGSSADPTLPLASADQVPVPAVRWAMRRLQTACTAALDEYDAVEWCRGHLSTALLLDSIGIQNADVAVAIERERQSAHRAFARAMERHLDASSDVAGARQMLTENTGGP